jgi:hypothetical protein
LAPRKPAAPVTTIEWFLFKGVQLRGGFGVRTIPECEPNGRDRIHLMAPVAGRAALKRL